MLYYTHRVEVTMSYKCYRCHKKLDDGVTKCDKCGAVKIDVSKKEDIKSDESKKGRFPYLIIIIAIVNIVFMTLAIKNFSNSDSLFLYGSIAIVVIVFGNILFPQSKLLKGILGGELLVVYGFITLPFIIIYVLFKEFVSGWI